MQKRVPESSDSQSSDPSNYEGQERAIRKRKRIRLEAVSQTRRNLLTMSGDNVIDSSFLPMEVLQNIFRWVPVMTVGCANLVCRQWKVSTEDEIFWRTLFINEYGYSGPPRAQFVSDPFPRFESYFASIKVIR